MRTDDPSVVSANQERLDESLGMETPVVEANPTGLSTYHPFSVPAKPRHFHSFKAPAPTAGSSTADCQLPSIAILGIQGLTEHVGSLVAGEASDGTLSPDLAPI